MAENKNACLLYTSIASSYLSEDDAMLGAEAQYCRMEQELQSYLDNYEGTHDYDEYHFDLDDIEHDPYVLISIPVSYTHLRTEPIRLTR